MTTSGSPDAIADLKRALRARTRRSALRIETSERARRSRTLEEGLLAVPELQRVRSVGLYAPLADEVQLELLPGWLQKRGGRVAYPRLQGDHLALHWVAAPGELATGARGLREPGPGAPAASPDSLDAILVPGLLFDRSGRRLGRGGGHYDRLLACVPARVLTIGLCLAEQLADRLPAEPHDVALRWVATDLEVLRIS